MLKDGGVRDGLGMVYCTDTDELPCLIEGEWKNGAPV